MGKLGNPSYKRHLCLEKEFPSFLFNFSECFFLSGSNSQEEGSQLITAVGVGSLLWLGTSTLVAIVFLAEPI